MTKALLFVGNALLDISINCDMQLLNKYHLKPDDNSEATSAQQGLFDEIFCQDNAIITPGGSSQNSARVAQQILNKLGSGTVYFIGCVGRDGYADILKEKLLQTGVKPLYDYHESAPTGIVAGLVLNNGQRSLCAQLGAAACFNRKYLNEPIVKSALMNANILYIEGFFLSHSDTCAFEVAQMAAEHDKMFALNLSGVYICKEHSHKVMECVPFCDVIVGNREEALTFVNAYKEAVNAVQCANYLASLPHCKSKSRIVIITQGPDPVIVVQGKLNPHFYPVPHVTEIADTIGCGDAFVGGFLAFILHGKNLDSAIKCGILVASEVAKHRGCTLPSCSVHLPDENC